MPRFKILPAGVLEVRFEPRTGSSGPSANQRLARLLVDGARESVRLAPRYDPGYRELSFPGGDPGWEVGCGADMVVRAYRALDVDLQLEIYEDIQRDATAYGVASANPSIDHRRLRNLERFLKRRAERLPTSTDADWQAGDLVLWSRDGSARANHVGIVSDRTAANGRPLVIHHLPGGPPREEDVLLAWPVREHLRWRPAAVGAPP